MSFTFFKYACDRSLGRQCGVGWKNNFYSALYTSIGPTKITDSTPCDGEDWGAVFGFGFSPDGSLLAAACENKCMLLYDPNNARLIQRRFRTHTDCVNCVRFLDNRMFATCSDDSTVRLWDARYLGQEFRILKGHTSWVKNIEYSCAEGKLITSGFDGNIFAWDINNYSENEKAEPLFYINGMMRTKITPDESKMIVSTLGGYFLLIHDLELDHLKEDLSGFKPHLYRLMQLMNTPLHHALQYNYMFTRKRNRVEFLCDFPEADNAESISTMQVHPQGWCISSRNTTLDEESEWTCIHDIQPLGNGNKIDLLREVTKTGDADFTIDSSQAGTERSGTGRLVPIGDTHGTPVSVRLGRLPPGNLFDYPPVFWGLQNIGSDANNSIARNGSDDNDNDSSDDDDEDDDVYIHSSDDEVAYESQRNQRLSSDDTSSEELSTSSFPSSHSSPERNSSTALLHQSFSPLQSNGAAASGSNTADHSSSTNVGFQAGEHASSSSSEHIDNRTPHSQSQQTSHGRSESSHANNESNHANDDRAPSGLVFYEAMTISRGGRVRRRMAIRHTGQDSQQPLSLRTGHMRIRNVKPRLLFYSEEPNVGRGYIKEQSFSPDGRVLASPFGNCVRLLAFSEDCSELCDCVPTKPRALKQVAMTMTQKSSILASTFSPNQCMFVAGARDGSISFCSPKL